MVQRHRNIAPQIQTIGRHVPDSVIGIRSTFQFDGMGNNIGHKPEKWANNLRACATDILSGDYHKLYLISVSSTNTALSRNALTYKLFPAQRRCRIFDIKLSFFFLQIDPVRCKEQNSSFETVETSSPVNKSTLHPPFLITTEHTKRYLGTLLMTNMGAMKQTGLSVLTLMKFTIY